MSLNLRRRLQIRRTARDLIAVASELGGPTTDDLLEASRLNAGFDSIRCAFDDLGAGIVASTKISNGHAIIRISRHCTTVRHTLAHEIGHIVLGHSLVDTTCFEAENGDCPPGFERLYLAMLPGGGQNQKDDGYSLRVEKEAEFFASEVLAILPGVRTTRAAREFMYGLA